MRATNAEQTFAEQYSRVSRRIDYSSSRSTVDARNSIIPLRDSTGANGIYGGRPVMFTQVAVFAQRKL